MFTKLEIRLNEKAYDCHNDSTVHTAAERIVFDHENCSVIDSAFDVFPCRREESRRHRGHIGHWAADIRYFP